MHTAQNPVITKENEVWVLRVVHDNGHVQEYRCATESQARQLAVVLTPKDQVLS